MNKHLYRPLLSLLGILLLLSIACSAPIRPAATPIQADQTQAILTIEAMMTRIADETNTPVPTSAPQSSAPTATSQGPTATPRPGATSPPQPTATPLCDQAAFISDVSVPDGTQITSGTQFKKTWRLQNKGTCTWTPDYAVTFDSGDRMGGPDAERIGVSVPPGGTVDVSVTLTAPGSPGDYRGLWKLSNAAGVPFGIGPAKSAFFVEIEVVTPAAGRSGYDFVANACSAEWTGGTQTIACLGRDGDEDGFVLTVRRPILESGYVDDEEALLTYPPRANDGVIRGKYPAYTVRQGDAFRSIIGCEYNASDCNVRFQLDYQIDNGPVQTLAAWNESYEGSFTTIDQDLSSLAGKTVQFILTVFANGSPNQDRALWLLPRIE